MKPKFWKQESGGIAATKPKLKQASLSHYCYTYSWGSPVGTSVDTGWQPGVYQTSPYLCSSIELLHKWQLEIHAYNISSE